jgi:hypothetical protein
LSGDLEFYLPFPLEVAALKEVNKVILYPSQTFAAYENGQLVRTGPTNIEKRSNSNWFVFLQIGKQRKPPVRLMTRD